MSSNPIITTFTTSKVCNICVTSSDRSSTTTTILLLWLVSIFSLSLQIIVVRTSTRINAANTTITTFMLFTSIRFNIMTATSTISITIMITVIIATISITAAVTITLISVIVLIRIIMISIIVAIIVTFLINCTMNVTILTASGNASVSRTFLIIIF